MFILFSIPKNSVVFTSDEKSYLDFIQRKISLVKTVDCSFQDFVDVVYSLGQYRQEIFDDDDLTNLGTITLLSYIDNAISALKVGGVI